ncbi:MAG: nucleotide exchange factor GrpE [Pirellulales bacterium]|nr:nucleotide exchange factor GrpE [Pirellulales bacterium]
MPVHSKDQPSREGGVVRPTDEQLEGATADGGPLPDVEATAAARGSDRETASPEAELAAERDRNLRLRAELENVRSRTARELAETHRYAALHVVRDLLSVLDNIDRAMEAAQKAGEAGPLVEGIRLVRQQLVSLLNRHHAFEIEALGQPFDPQFHEAILHQPSGDVPADHVTLVTQTGYRMHDRVVRPAQVIVSSGPPQ